MRIYNVLGYSALGLQLALSAWLAPPSLGPWWGMAIGFGYLVMSWFLAGVYLSDVMHMSGLPMPQPSIHSAGLGRSRGSPCGVPPSTHFTIVSISDARRPIWFENLP